MIECSLLKVLVNLYEFYAWKCFIRNNSGLDLILVNLIASDFGEMVLKCGCDDPFGNDRC